MIGLSYPTPTKVSESRNFYELDRSILGAKSEQLIASSKSKSRVYRTLEMIVACKELTVGAGNLMQMLHSGNSITCSRADSPQQRTTSAQALTKQTGTKTACKSINQRIQYLNHSKLVNHLLNVRFIQ